MVADIQQAPIGRRIEPVIYHTQRQFPFRAMTLVGRGPDTATVVAGVRTALRGLDASLPLGNLRTMDERFVAATAGPRLLTGVLITFAALTAVLAVKRNRPGRSAAMLPLKIGNPRVSGIVIDAPVTDRE